MARFVKIARAEELAPGQCKDVEIDGKPIAVFNVEGTFYAVASACTHEGGPLCEGELFGEEVTCPWHGAVFNVKTGAVVGPPAEEDLARYNVRVTEGYVEVEV